VRVGSALELDVGGGMLTAKERLRAIELLAAAGGSEDEAAVRLALRILQMSEVELRHEMTGFFRTDGGATSR
jgi:hypothetical protein